MNIRLIRADVSDAQTIWKMQVDSFAELYKKYGDTETNPAAEDISRTIERLEQSFTCFYFITADGKRVGALRVVDKGNAPKRISPVFVLPEYRCRGIAEKAILEAEKLHGASGWELETILEEESLCRFYERLGYVRTGKTERINDKMTLVYYNKYCSAN